MSHTSVTEVEVDEPEPTKTRGKKSKIPKIPTTKTASKSTAINLPPPISPNPTFKSLSVRRCPNFFLY